MPRETLRRRKIGKYSVAFVNNRNEERVLELAPFVLREFEGLELNQFDVADVYALALNSLPPRYARSDGSALFETVSDDQVRESIREAVRRVAGSPRHRF
jgi:Flp pilus assembly CpaE family ATPase